MSTQPRAAARAALEVSVTSPSGVKAAGTGGADRVQLCSALELGGLTPSLATIESCVGVDGGPGVHVLVRPRPGDFVYDAEENRTALQDVVHAVRVGAAGVVVGSLTASGALDLRFLASVVAAARAIAPHAEVTLHRAVDLLPRPSEHVGWLQRLGLTRVMTSGGASSALDGAVELGRAVSAAGPVQVMAAGGVGPASVTALVAAGVAAVHVSATRAVAGQGPSREGLDGGVRWVTDPGVIAATRAALDAAVGRRDG